VRERQFETRSEAEAAAAAASSQCWSELRSGTLLRRSGEYVVT
jgi:hypothetical protein